MKSVISTFGTPDPSREKTKAKENSISTSPADTPTTATALYVPLPEHKSPWVYAQWLLTF